MFYNLTQPSLPLSTANSPPGGGPGALSSLPAPIGVNGFSPLTTQTNGQLGSDTLYNNGLSPYPGRPPKWSGEQGTRSRRALLLGKGFLCSSSTLHSPKALTGPRPPAFTMGLAPLSPAQSPGVADPLQQAYAGMHHYAGFTGHCAGLGGGEGPQKGARRSWGAQVLFLGLNLPILLTTSTPTTSLVARVRVDWLELVTGEMGPSLGLTVRSVPTPDSVSSSLSIGLCPSEHNFSPTIFNPAPAAKRR